MMDGDALAKRAAEIKWFHTIDLGHGVVTRGSDKTPAKLERVRMPQDLSGKTVLDVGAWDGFFSFEAERRGAERVVAVDSFTWEGHNWGSKHGFELAREALQSRVEDRHMDVLDLSPESIGVFDITLFLGVFYHMRHPLLALERVASVTGEMLILETAVDLIHLPTPALAFYPGSELQDDATNWFGPNPRALCRMLEVVGFSRVELIGRPRSLAYSLWRSAGRILRKGPSHLHALQRNRAIVHAWK